MHKSIEERFWAKVIKTESCWLWQGGKNRGSYGHFNITRGTSKYVLAHRYSYELHYEPIPTGMWVCHHCDNPSCVNPAHLFLGTPRDNSQDSIQKHRGKRGPRKLSEEQVLWARAMFSSGWRIAKIAKSLRVSWANIYLIVHRKAWKELC
jgi:hypothetical protein